MKELKLGSCVIIKALYIVKIVTFPNANRNNNIYSNPSHQVLLPNKPPHPLNILPSEVGGTSTKTENIEENKKKETMDEDNIEEVKESK